MERSSESAQVGKVFGPYPTFDWQRSELTAKMAATFGAHYGSRPSCHARSSGCFHSCCFTVRELCCNRADMSDQHDDYFNPDGC